MILPEFEGYTAIIIGTGPSVNEDVVDIVKRFRSLKSSNFRIFAVNNAFQLDIQKDVFFACNPEWWDHYHEDPSLKHGMTGCAKWTWDLATARRYNLNWIEGRWSGGPRKVTSLSTDPNYIHYGHGSGYEVLGLAYHYGCRHFILAGYDLSHGRGYDSRKRKIGEPRHFFGEYPKSLQHFPKAGKDGQMTGLLDCYRTIDTKKLGLRITNTSPGTALDFFDTGDLEKVLHEENTAKFRMDY